MTYSKLNLISLINSDITLEKGIFLVTEMFKELLTEKDELKLKSEKFKPIIIEYLIKEKETTTSQLAKTIGLSYEDTFYILKELEKKHKLVIV